MFGPNQNTSKVNGRLPQKSFASHFWFGGELPLTCALCSVFFCVSEIALAKKELDL